MRMRGKLALAIAATITATLASFTPAAADELNGPGEGMSASEFKSSGEEFRRECPSQDNADGCLLFVSDGVSDMETAALAYSLYQLEGKGIDEYLQNLSAERRASAQEKLDALNESPEALKQAAVMGDAGTNLGTDAPRSSGILTTRVVEYPMLFGWCSETCTVFQTVTMETSLEQTFFPEMSLFGDISADNGTFQLTTFDCKMTRINIPFPSTVAHNFPTCSPMLFPSTSKQIFVGTWEHERYWGQAYNVMYTGHITPRPDINSSLTFEYGGQRHWIDFAGNFFWQDF